jgi:cytochrome c-type biogenesis protein CcmE
MKKRNMAILMVALALLAAAVYFMSDDLLSPYVTFKEAKSNAGKYVQIIGRLDKSIPVLHQEGVFTFTVKDKDESTMKVIHRGIKPQNFDQTEQIVLLGKYNPKDEIFTADNILVKCPSKYRRKKYYEPQR